MEQALHRHFRGIADWQAPSGGLFFWLRLQTECDTLAALQRALEHDVAFMPGTPFFPDGEHRYAALRLNFSHAGPDAIQHGIAALAGILTDFMSEQKERGRPKENGIEASPPAAVYFPT
ncbi:MAG: aminotransferase [Proteobacteria bacterium]|nr:aminotransferase [Pseudomonadota bacterium]